MEGVSSLPGDVYKESVDRTLKELENAIREVEETLSEVCPLSLVSWYCIFVLTETIGEGDS